eukprot:Unigene6100_Nuclearia_a/m.18689 Unigene6100_Nuclearia_a/g.18689  ORF Unigene6100_Nuclearia_a/g.18689 Unigene6100_Nuclearia_a/m.18689 type:complete len:330 (-) Unigene6100_Nuclearia_a:109-1098(-)
MLRGLVRKDADQQRPPQPHPLGGQRARRCGVRCVVELRRATLVRRPHARSDALRRREGHLPLGDGEDQADEVTAGVGCSDSRVLAAHAADLDQRHVAVSRPRMNAALSAASMSASPTSTARTPCASYAATSARPVMPDSAASTTSPSREIISASDDVVFMSTVKLCKLRLLTPITREPSASARRISSALFTSTSGSIPRARDVRINSRSSSSDRHATISSTVSAPATRASSTWYSSTIKSFRKNAGRASAPTLRSIAARASRRSSRWPLNHVGSVRTEIAAAPACAYVRAVASASAPGAMSPLDGDARLISPITATWLAGGCTARRSRA